MKRLLMIAALAATVALGPGMVDAQSRAPQSKSSKSERASSQSSRQKSTQKQVSGQGRIMRLKKVDVRNRDTVHLVALVSLQNGRRGVVDLGPMKSLSRFKFQQGDSISFRGKTMTVGDRGVLMATHVKKEGKDKKVDRGSQAPQIARRVVRRADLSDSTSNSQSARSQSARSRSGNSSKSRRAAVSGKLEQAKRVRVKNLGTDHAVVLVRTDEGKARIVDLGPVENLRSVRFAKGDTFAALGDVVAVGDRYVLMAERIRTGDREHTIKRQKSPKRSQRSSTSRSSNQQDRSN